MRLLFDQNISYRILKYLPSNIEATHVSLEGLLNSSDYEVWEYARINNYTIVTQDSDFNDIYIIKGFPPKIIWIQTGNMKKNEFIELLNEHFKQIQSFIKDDDQGCLEILKII